MYIHRLDAIRGLTPVHMCMYVYTYRYVCIDLIYELQTYMPMKFCVYVCIYAQGYVYLCIRHTYIHTYTLHEECISLLSWFEFMHTCMHTYTHISSIKKVLFLIMAQFGHPIHVCPIHAYIHTSTHTFHKECASPNHGAILASYTCMLVDESECTIICT